MGSFPEPGKCRQQGYYTAIFGTPGEVEEEEFFSLFLELDSVKQL